MDITLPPLHQRKHEANTLYIRFLFKSTRASTYISTPKSLSLTDLRSTSAIANADGQTMPSTSSYVCFSCRTHRSQDRFPKIALPTPECHSCKEKIYHLGHKIEIPPHTNIKGWALLYDFLTRPAKPGITWRSCEDLDPRRHRENLHWADCKVRKDDSGRGCNGCEEVGNRTPDFGKVGTRWNEVVY